MGSLWGYVAGDASDKKREAFMTSVRATHPGVYELMQPHAPDNFTLCRIDIDDALSAFDDRKIVVERLQEAFDALHMKAGAFKLARLSGDVARDKDKLCTELRAVMLEHAAKLDALRMPAYYLWGRRIINGGQLLVATLKALEPPKRDREYGTYSEVFRT